MFILEAVFHFIFEVFLMYLGAFVRWVFGGMKKSFSHYLASDTNEDAVSSYTGLAFFLLVLFIAQGISLYTGHTSAQ